MASPEPDCALPHTGPVVGDQRSCLHRAIKDVFFAAVFRMTFYASDEQLQVDLYKLPIIESAARRVSILRGLLAFT
jgi:hypothetical protein